MQLQDYLRAEGRQAHDTILYRRLALLPGLCNGSAAVPSAAVLRGAPSPAPPLQEKKEISPDFRWRVLSPPRQPATVVHTVSESLSPAADSLRRSVKGAQRQKKGGGDTGSSPRLSRQHTVASRSDAQRVHDEAVASLRGEGPQLDGIQELHKSIASITAILRQTKLEYSECFKRLSCYVKAYTHDTDAVALSRLLEVLSVNEADVAGTSRAALFLMDHCFFLLRNLHPGLDSTLRWCRERLSRALYCPETNIHPNDIGNTEENMRVSEGLYLGHPGPLPEDHIVDVLGSGGTDVAAINILMERYRGRLACEDNIELQADIQDSHQLIRIERAHAQRQMQAECSVTEYWKRTVRALLFMAWREVIARQKSDRTAQEDKLLLERELALAKRATAEQIKEKARVEGLMFDQVMNMDQKVKQTAQSLNECEEKLKEEKARNLDLQKTLLQLKAEQMLLRDRVRRALAKQDTAQRNEAEMKAQLEKATATASRLSSIEEQHCALNGAATALLKRMQLNPAALAIPAESGALVKWYTTLYGGKFPGAHLLDNLTQGLQHVFPNIVSTIDVDRVQREKDDVEKASVVAAVLRKLFGNSLPVHPNSLVLPVSRDVVMHIASLVAAKACQPTPAADSTSIPEEGTELCDALQGMQEGLLHMTLMHQTLASDLHRCPMTVLGATSFTSMDPPQWVPKYEHEHKSNTIRNLPIKKLEAAKARVLDYASELTEIRATYGTVFLIPSNVQDLVHDVGLQADTELEVMTCLPRGAREEVVDPMLSVALLAGAVKAFPGLLPDSAFDTFMREVVLPGCKAITTRGRLADVLVLYREAAMRTYHRLGATVLLKNVADYLESCTLLTSVQEADSWTLLTTRGLCSAYERFHRVETGRAPMQNTPILFHHFQYLLCHAAFMKYPAAAVPEHARVERLFKEVLQFTPGEM